MRYGLVLTTGPVSEPVTVQEARLQLRVTDGKELQLDPGGVAVNGGGGVTTLPSDTHGLSTDGGEKIIVSGTDNYDGVYFTTAATTADVIAITKTFVAETFVGDEYVQNDGAEDDKILALTIAARKLCEQWQNRSYITQTWTQTFDWFPAVIEPARPKLITVTHLKYIDTGGTQRTLVEDTDFLKDIQSTPGRIYPVFGLVWPATRVILNAIELKYTAGYGTTRASTPETAKQAMLLLLAHWFENREEVVLTGMPQKLPEAAELLLMIDRDFV